LLYESSLIEIIKKIFFSDAFPKKTNAGPSRFIDSNPYFTII